jgi:uncharacterized protein
VRPFAVLAASVLVAGALAAPFPGAPRQATPVPAAWAAPGDTVAPELGAARAYVTDDAGILKAGAQGRIERYLEKVERELNVQMAVVTVPTTRPGTIEEYAVELFEQWGIGGARADEGLLLVVAVNDRKVRFEVGYGLEAVLPDGRAGGIIRGKITPAFREGDYGGGILAGLVEAARFIAEAAGKPPPLPDDGPPATPRETGPDLPWWLILILAWIVLQILVSMFRGGGGGGRGRRRRGGGFGPFVWTGGGGFGSGGGGFGGGWGGGGFGGGASGGGFGGFGGGASGGGGATGSW